VGSDADRGYTALAACRKLSQNPDFVKEKTLKKMKYSIEDPQN
jgi:hypothetical protein